MSSAPRIAIISQARMSSTRLPGKVLLPAGGDTLLGWHLRRLRQTGLPVLLATTTNATDDVLAGLGAALGVPVTRGDEHDVLARFQLCAQEHDLDAVVRVTSDCPLLAPELITAGVARYRAAADPRLYLSNVLHRTYPRGYDFEIFSRELLDEAARQARRPAEREHVTPYINQNRSSRVNFAHFTRAADASRFRLTVDTPADFALISALLTDHAAGELSGEELITLLEAHPELVALNAGVEQKLL